MSPAVNLGTPHEEIFALMEIAEEELRGRDRPGLFMLLTPGVLVKLHPELYRGHVRELLARVEAGQDTRPGTKAEVLAYLSMASLKAPLNSTGEALMASLWSELFPGQLEGLLVPSRDEELIQEEYALASRKARVESRKLP